MKTPYRYETITHDKIGNLRGDWLQAHAERIEEVRNEDYELVDIVGDAHCAQHYGLPIILIFRKHAPASKEPAQKGDE